MLTQRIVSITNRREQDRLWNFYSTIFTPLDEESPIRQSFPRSDFYMLLKDKAVIKFVTKDITGQLLGFGMITSKIELETFFSMKYFKKKYNGIPLYYVIAIAVRPDLRKTHFAFDLLGTMLLEVPPEGRGIFMHSSGANHAIAHFAEIASKGKIQGIVLDAEAVSIYSWK